MNTIVEEIHSTFAGAEEALLREAQAILSASGDEEQRERATALARMGFTQSAPVRRLSPEEQDRASTLLAYSKRYQRIAPQYKFITEEKLIEICKRYGLVVGSSERYTQDIPERNQQDILGFKVLDESFLEINDDTYRKSFHTTGKGERLHPKEMGSDHIEHLLAFWRRHLCRDQSGAYMSKNAVEDIPVGLLRTLTTELVLRGEQDVIDVQKNLWHAQTVFNKSTIEELFTSLKTTYFYVAADVDSFDTKGVDLKENFLVERSNDKALSEAMKRDLFRAYDPIALAKVQGGYLIVTAWGLEASDPDVVSPGRN